MRKPGALLTAGVLVFSLALVAAASSAPTRPSGTLKFNATVVQNWRMSDDYCPPGTLAVADCLRSVGEGSIAGLGRVMVTYFKVLPNDGSSCFIVHNNTALIEVEGKGTLELSKRGRSCASRPPPREDGPFEFAIASGSGRYAGATGRLVYRSSVGPASFPCHCGKARDTWTGTLIVPGLDFDVTPPVLTGAVSRTTHAPKGAKRARVRYAVTANDAVDGSVRVVCNPHSGSQFKVGRTGVTCSAADSSANKGVARFTITVRPRR